MSRSARLVGLVVLVYAVLRVPVAASAEPGVVTAGAGRRGAAAAGLRADRLLVGCVTHLDTDPANTPSQVAAVAAAVAGFPAVVVGGDVNALPDSAAMAPLYARFREVGGDSPGAVPSPAAGPGAGWAARPARSTTSSCPAATPPTRWRGPATPRTPTTSRCGRQRP